MERILKYFTDEELSIPKVIRPLFVFCALLLYYCKHVQKVLSSQFFPNAYLLQLLLALIKETTTGVLLMNTGLNNWFAFVYLIIFCTFFRPITISRICIFMNCVNYYRQKLLADELSKSPYYHVNLKYVLSGLNCILVSSIVRHQDWVQH